MLQRTPGSQRGYYLPKRSCLGRRNKQNTRIERNQTVRPVWGKNWKTLTKQRVVVTHHKLNIRFQTLLTRLRSSQFPAKNSTPHKRPVTPGHRQNWVIACYIAKAQQSQHRQRPREGRSKEESSPKLESSGRGITISTANVWGRCRPCCNRL